MTLGLVSVPAAFSMWALFVRPQEVSAFPVWHIDIPSNLAFALSFLFFALAFRFALGLGCRRGMLLDIGFGIGNHLRGPGVRNCLPRSIHLRLPAVAVKPLLIRKSIVCLRFRVSALSVAGTAAVGEAGDRLSRDLLLR